MRMLLPVIGLLALGACATTKEAQVRSSLIDAGLPTSTAECMAEPLARDLTTSQLKSLARVARQVSGSGRGLSNRQVLDLVSRDVDPETVGVVMRAGVGCFLRG